MTHTCQYPITRLNAQASFNYTAVVNAGVPWVDASFTGSDALYWHDWDEGNLDGYLDYTYWQRANASISGGISLWG